MPAPLPAAAAALALSSAPSGRPLCHTPERLAHGWREGIDGESQRPDAVGYVDSEIYPLRIHYRKDGDGDRAAEVILPAAEYAWQVEVEEMGWPAPPSDGGLGGSEAVDLYLTNEDTYGGAWTWGPRSDVIDGDDYYSVAAFIALDDNKNMLTDDMMPTFVVHEFNHVLQYGIDGVEATGFVWESTAEAMEELTLPDSDLYWYDVPEFQSLPFESLLFDGYSREVSSYDSYSTYEYGGCISGLYLEQAYGDYDGRTLLQLWLDMAQPDNSNEPDYVDALGEIGGDDATTFEDVYLGLAEWRMFANEDDDGAHYMEGASWNRKSRVATEGELSLASLDGVEVTPADEPYDLGTSYWSIDVDGDTTIPLDLEVEGEGDVGWGVVAAAWQDGAPARVVRARGEDGEGVSTSLDLSGATKIMVGVTNLGVSDLNAEGQHERLGFTLRLRHAAPDSGEPQDDTGDDTGAPSPTSFSDTYAGGCACGTVGGAGRSWAGLGLLAVGALVARRRSPR